MRVLLARRFALKRRANGFGRTNEIFIGDIQCRTRTSVARINKLNSTHRGGQRNGRQLEQARGFLDLGFFQPQSIGFHRPEDLFNSPPQPVEADDFLCGDKFVNNPTVGLDVVLPITTMITCAAPHSRSPNGRAVDPTEGFFIFNRPRSAWRFLLDRSRPDVRMHHAEHCLVPPGVFPVAGRPKTLP